MKIRDVAESIDSRVAPVAPPLRIQPTRTQPNQNVYVAPEKKTPAAIIHIGKKEVKEFAPPGGDDREPDEEHILRQLAAQWWLGTEQQMARAQQTLQSMGWEIGQDESGDDDAGVFVVRAGDVNGDSYIAFPHSELSLDEGLLAAAIGGGLLWHALKDDDIDDESVYDDEAHEYGMQAYHDGEAQDDNPYSEDFPNARRAWDYGWAEAHNGDIEQKAPLTAPTKTAGPADFSKRGFTGYKKPGDVDEGVRVPAQQILGTKNRAKSAYYPTNVKPKVPKLDKPLTDQELARLSQLAGIKTNK
jgi:hypothetical protein